MPLKTAVNTYMVYQFIRELTRSWSDMKAFELGIIDDQGNLLKKAKDLKTSEERAAYTLFHRLVWNTKRMLEKLPGGASKIKSYAAAAFLLKENKEAIKAEMINLVEYAEVTEARELIEFIVGSKDVALNEEDGPTNVTGAIAQKDQPLCSKKKKKSKDGEDMEDNTVCSLRRKIEEGKELKRVVRGGTVKKKITCPDGQIVKGGKCVPKTSKDKQRFVKAARKRKRSLAGKSTLAAQRKRKRSVRKRNTSGL